MAFFVLIEHFIKGCITHFLSGLMMVASEVNSNAVRRVTVIFIVGVREKIGVGCATASFWDAPNL